MQTFTSSKTQSWLTWFLKGILVLVFFILIARLFELQIIRGDYFRSLAEGNRIRRVSIEAPRGRIVARSGETLVGNREIKRRLVFHPEVGYEKLADIKGANEDEIITEPMRDYKLGANFAHVSGYLGEVNEREVGKINPQCQDKGPRLLGSLIGRTGLESYYECELSGINGEELVEVDSGGNKIRTLGRREPVPGEDVGTTIDYGFQEKVSQLMQENKGAAIVTDTKGQVLAFYSSPSFDPNIFVSERDDDRINVVLTDKDMPLFNRVISGRFHPGSVFKPVVSIAALEEGKIDEDFVYEDTGQIVVESMYGEFSYKNWYFTQYGGVEGKIDITRALGRSTDTFFYKIGELLGIDNIVTWSGKFGLDKETGIDIPGEVSGLVPSPEWKERVRGERWFLGNTYHISIGQGDLAVTPLGINSAISVIASGGNLCRSYVVDKNDSENIKCEDLGISKESIKLVTEGMVAACSDEGTGYTFFDVNRENMAQGGKVACKTGTAEVDDGSEDTHAWFTFFAPSDNPEIVATVLVEKGGEGSKVAGPIAREIYDFWFAE